MANDAQPLLYMHRAVLICAPGSCDGLYSGCIAAAFALDPVPLAKEHRKPRVAFTESLGSYGVNWVLPAEEATRLHAFSSTLLKLHPYCEGLNGINH